MKPALFAALGVAALALAPSLSAPAGWAQTLPAQTSQSIPAQAPSSIPASDDEFVGPFPSWTNVKTAYGAVGDGVADDTAALARGLTELGSEGHAPVLFVPRGTYRITRTLALASGLNVSLVGEDPATTSLVWDGAAGGTMLSMNGVAYSRFTRLTFNGRSRASVAVEQAWDNVRPPFDTGNEYSDDVFVDVEYGIRGGFKGFGFAETSVRRTQFVRNTKAGISLGNFNALDLWVWYSTFDHCGIGVTNGEGAGNFHVYNSVFRESAVADLFMQNTGGFSARGNYSVHAKSFFSSQGVTSNPATITLQGNVIVDPIDQTTIKLANQGPGLLVDNIIRSAEGAVGPAVDWTSLIDADMTSIGNTFTVPRPLKGNGRVLSIGDRNVPRSSVMPVEPTLPPAAPNLQRRVFEVARGADGRAIQQAINAAAALGARAVVHLPSGTYMTPETLTIPSSDVQLVGDGYGTIVRWGGAGPGPVVRVAGPSKATLRELQIDGAGKADGLVVAGVDQPGSRVYMDQAQLRSGKVSDLFVNGLDSTVVQLEDMGNAGSPDGTSIRVVGGPVAAGGGISRARTNIFSGASSGNRVSYDVSNGARILVRDLWYESGAGPGFARVHGKATMTVDGSRISSQAGQPVPAFDIQDLDGRVTIVTTHIDDRVAVSGAGGAANVLGMALFAEQKDGRYFSNAARPLARAVLSNSRHLSAIPGSRSAPTANVGMPEPSFVEEMLAQARSERPERLRALAPGVTDLRLFRVWVTSDLNGISLLP